MLCIEALNAARLRAGWKAKRIAVTSEAQCTRALAWFRERVQGERAHRVDEDAADMIQAVVWAHRRVPECDGVQTDLRRIWKGTAQGQLKVLEWIDEWNERGRPDAEVHRDVKPATRKGGGFKPTGEYTQL